MIYISLLCQVVVLFRVFRLFRGPIVSSSNEPRNTRNTRKKTQSGRTNIHLNPVERGHDGGHLQGGELSDHGVLLSRYIKSWAVASWRRSIRSLWKSSHETMDTVRAPGGARFDLQSSWTKAEVLCRPHLHGQDHCRGEGHQDCHAWPGSHYLRRPALGLPSCQFGHHPMLEHERIVR